MQIKNKKEIPNILEVKIEKLSNNGFGIAKLDGYVIFVESACPQDFVKIQLTKKNKNFGFGKIIEMLEPSPYRITPKCSMQKVCGACQLQFIDYEEQLKQKKEIVIDTMRSIYGKEIEIRDVVASPKIWEYRHKIQYPISETKESKRILAGYYKPSSHDIVNIKYCPIQPNYCDTVIDYIRENAKNFDIKGFNEKKHSGDLRHVVMRVSEINNKILIVLVMNSHKLIKKFKDFAIDIYNKFENISGVCINYNPNKTNLILGEKTELIVGAEFIEENLCEKTFKIGANTFFQINPSSANNIFNYVKNYIKNNFKEPIILDAYAGITAFGICLSPIAHKVVSVEEVKASVDMASKIIKENNIRNVELHNMDASKFFEKELKTKNRSFNITVLDPPRKGCTQESLDYALKLTKNKIIYVSCNPATLARDLKYLSAKGCEVEFIQPFDMFPHTYHIENVAIIKLPVN